MENEPPSLGGVVHRRPGDLDFLQLPKTPFSEGLNGDVIAGLLRERAKLGVELRPGQGERLCEREGAVGEPQIEIEAQGGPAQGVEACAAIALLSETPEIGELCRVGCIFSASGIP